jgi:hypothetical protein
MMPPKANNSAKEASEDAAPLTGKTIRSTGNCNRRSTNPGTSVTCDELGNENGTAAYELKKLPQTAKVRGKG